LDNCVELALANLDLNEPMLERVTFDYGDSFEGSSSIGLDADLGLDIEEDEEEDGGEGSGSGSVFDDFDM
jgi:hypothetical protein